MSNNRQINEHYIEYLTTTRNESYKKRSKLQHRKMHMIKCWVKNIRRKYEVSVWEDENILEMHYSDGCTTMCT